MRQRIQQRLRVLSYNIDGLVAAAVQDNVSLYDVYIGFFHSFRQTLTFDSLWAENHQYDLSYKC